MSSPPAGTRNPFVVDCWINLERWLRKTVRNPFVVVSSLLNPIIFLWLFTAVFGSVTGGALTSTLGENVNYITYLVPAIVIQTALIAASSSGIGLVDDIESGMFEKVLVSPMRRSAVFLGKALSEVLRIVVQVSIVLGLGYVLLWADTGGAVGTYVATGWPGVVGIFFISICFAVWFTALSNLMALWTRDQESTIIGANLVQLPLLFVSSAFLPLAVLPGWIQTVARFNPVTYGVDAVRALMLGQDLLTVISINWFGGVWNTLVPALGVLIGLDLVLGGIAVWSLNRATSADVE
ncbi:ABC transporter permease [Halocatena halophila]|uniref:ABC transporter permease n=1 Tax=Halocatena halophila TaxID=2814576 RepID=UPI002ED64310